MDGDKKNLKEKDAKKILFSFIFKDKDKDTVR